MVILFRGVSVVKVSGGLVSLIFLIGLSPLIPQVNFLDLIKYLINRGIPG